jgi:hypothetical protein
MAKKYTNWCNWGDVLKLVNKNVKICNLVLARVEQWASLIMVRGLQLSRKFNFLTG